MHLGVEIISGGVYDMLWQFFFDWYGRQGL